MPFYDQCGRLLAKRLPIWASLKCVIGKMVNLKSLEGEPI